MRPVAIVGFHSSHGDQALLVALLLSLPAAPPFADARGDAQKQVQFGIAVAQRGLWREAIYRWERAAQLDPHTRRLRTTSRLRYEHEGELDQGARRLREGASSSSPAMRLIKQNYELFREINDRTNRKDSQ